MFYCLVFQYMPILKLVKSRILITVLLWEEKVFMDKVLVVDDNADFLKTLQDELSLYVGQFEVLTATGGAEAIKILQKKKVSLVVTDLMMPEVGGIHLLAYMTKNHSSIPCIVMTRGSGFALSDYVSRRDLIRYIDKNAGVKELASAIIEGLDFLDEGSSLGGLAVSNVLPFIEMARLTGMLHIDHPSKGHGTIYFKDGFLFDALFEDMEPESAALEIISWKKVIISILPTPEYGGEKRINASLEYLMDQMTGQAESPVSEQASVIPEEFIEAPRSQNIIVEEAQSEGVFEEEILLEDISTSEDRLSQKLDDLCRLSGVLGIGLYSLNGQLLGSASKESNLMFQDAGSRGCDTITKARGMLRVLNIGSLEELDIITASGERVFIRLSVQNPFNVVAVLVCSRELDVKIARQGILDMLPTLIEDLKS
jgi:CheY-like chemotaxis protein